MDIPNFHFIPLSDNNPFVSDAPSLQIINIIVVVVYFVSDKTLGKDGF